MPEQPAKSSKSQKTRKPWDVAIHTASLYHSFNRSDLRRLRLSALGENQKNGLACCDGWLGVLHEGV
jgi:hypothetical protein